MDGMWGSFLADASVEEMPKSVPLKADYQAEYYGDKLELQGDWLRWPDSGCICRAVECVKSNPSFRLREKAFFEVLRPFAVSGPGLGAAYFLCSFTFSRSGLVVRFPRCRPAGVPNRYPRLYRSKGGP